MNALAAALQPQPALVVLDLRQLTYIDARSAGGVAMASERISVWGGRLAAREPQGVIRRVFELCGLGHLVHSREGVARAATWPPMEGSGFLPAEAGPAPQALGSAA